tara:strand:+ start:192 stop:500 length:309 start_codon:yes stop_codon:yes gene_type:complete
MIEVSLFYVLGGLIMLPSTTFLITRLYYTKVIHSYERRLWVYENVDNVVDINNLINEVEQRSKNFREKQTIISNFLEHKSDNNKVVIKSNMVQEMKNKFDNN